jgi:N-acetylneuraminic acid mutarotase
MPGGSSSGRRARAVARAILFATLAGNSSAGAAGWSSGPNLSVPRTFSAVGPMNDGRVFVFGGRDATSFQTDIEIFDPARTVWQKYAFPYSAALGPTTTATDYGRLIISGGLADVPSVVTISCAPDTNCTADPDAKLTQGRYYHTATLLPNASGDVLIVGGLGTTALKSVNLLRDFSTTLPRADLHDARSSHTATLLSDGTILVVGGANGNDPVATAERYSFYQNAWSYVAPMKLGGRCCQTATMLPDGRVLIAGGKNGSYLATAEIYDPANDTWEVAASMSKARAYHTANLLPNGKVLVAGGEDESFYHASTEIFDPADNTWSDAGNMPVARSSHSAALLPSGKVLMISGKTNSWLASTSIYDPADPLFAPAAPMQGARFNHSTTLLPDGRALAVGGWDSAGQSLASCETYDPAANTWNFVASTHAPHAFFSAAATLLNSGKVLLTDQQTVEIYDVATDQWKLAQPFPSARNFSAATLLADGRVLVVGGADGGTALATTLIYEPLRNDWVAGPPMNEARKGPAASLLAGNPNCVLVSGGMGSGGIDLASSEYWCPGDATWTPTGALPYKRSFHRSILLDDGSVLASGDPSSRYSPITQTWANVTGNSIGQDIAKLTNGAAFTVATGTPNARLLQPGASSWTSGGASTVAPFYVHGYTLTRLLDGRVLVAGGRNYVTNDVLTRAELYDPGLAPVLERRPQITFVAPLRAGKEVTITGTNLRTRLEASGGNWQGTATNRATVSLTSLGTGQTRWLRGYWLADYYTYSAGSNALEGFPLGSVLVTAFVNGMPSVSFATTVGSDAVFADGFNI